MIGLGLGLNRQSAVRSSLSGIPFPGEVLTSPRAGQWHLSGVPISGQTGTTYTVGVRDIGQTVRCGNGQTVLIWHPRNIAAVKECWLPYVNVFNSISPSVPAVDGQTVRRWQGVVSNYQADQSAGISQPSLNVAAFGTGLPGLAFDGTNSLLRAIDGSTGMIRNCGCAYIISSYRLAVFTSTKNNYIASFNRPTADGVMLGLSASFASSGPTVFTRRTFAQVTGNSAAFGSVNTAASFVDTNEADYANNTLRARRDGVLANSTAITGSGLSENQNTADFEIGCFSQQPQNAFNGLIGAVIVAAGNTVLSTLDRNRLEQYAGLCAGKDLGLSVS